AGTTRTIVGVASPDVQILVPADHWIPAPVGVLTRPGPTAVAEAIGRIQFGITLEQAEQELRQLAARQGEPLRFTPVPRSEVLFGDVRVPLFVLLGAVGFVLLIACTNVANLTLVRSVSRQGEMAIRTAIGAGGLRLIRQLLIESLVLSTIGAAVGLLI